MVQYIRSDLEFILAQIQIAEAHTAAGGSQADLLALVGNNALPLGIRTVDGTFNNLVPGQEDFGSADQPFDHLVPPDYLPGYTPTPGAGSGVTVVDSAPRTISNLISDQSASNPAAVRAALAAIGVTGAAADAAAADIAAAVAAVSAAKSTHGALFAGNFAANGADDTAAAVEPAIAALAAAIGDGTLDGDEDGLADAAIALAEADASRSFRLTPAFRRAILPQRRRVPRRPARLSPNFRRSRPVSATESTRPTSTRPAPPSPRSRPTPAMP